MEDLFKKFVNAGVGYIAQGNKKIQSTIDALVKDSKITEQEGKKIVDELLKSSETKRAELEKQFQGLTERVKSTVGLGDKKKAPAKAASKPTAKPASSATSKAAGTVKKAADKVSTAAGTAQKSAAAKAGAAKKPAPKKAAAPAAKAEDNA
jgi:polyhydroxyalkanoate synthesis regulator phasin